MPRAGITRDAVIGRAEELVDERGLGSLTLAEIARSLGIRQPSLYKHVDGQAELLRELATRARLDLGAVLGRAAVGRSGDDAVLALAMAYRQWARTHPGRYEATVRAPDPDDAEGVRSSGAVVEVVVAVLAGYGLAGPDVIDATRALRAALHGFVSIELAHGFGLPQDVDRSYALMVAAMTRALAAWGAGPPAGR